MNLIHLWDGEDVYNADYLLTVKGISLKPRIFRNVGRMKIISLNGKLHFPPVPYSDNVYHAPILINHYGTINQSMWILMKILPIAGYFLACYHIIGSGYSIMKGIQFGKKVIVAGAKGYGGTVTVENIRDHYQNYFQGGNGGQIGEFIPINLILNDINGIMNKNDKKKTTELLNNLMKIQKTVFMEKTEQIIKLSKQPNHFLSLKFKINADYVISASKGRIYLVNKYLNNKYKRFNESEYVIFSEFKESKKIEDVLNKYPKEYQTDIKEFIDSLIGFKIIVPEP